MAKRSSKDNKDANINRLRIGNMVTQATINFTKDLGFANSTNQTDNSTAVARNVSSAFNTRSASSQTTRRARRRGTVQAFTTIRNRSVQSLNISKPVLPIVAPLVNLPLTTPVTQIRVPLTYQIPIQPIRIALPLIFKQPAEEFSDDVLDVGETKIENGTFVPVEKNGISSFVPEVLQITDFKSIWKKDAFAKRYFEDFSPAGKLIDVQYNSLLLRRETINNLLENLKNSRKENTKKRGTQGRKQRSINSQIDSFEKNVNDEIARTRRTVYYYKQFVRGAETLKKLLDIKSIPKSKFNKQLLSLEDFYQQRMQFSKEQFEISSDTKIIMQLLADFKEISENYSTSLLGLVDPDRKNDENPISIDKSYTLNDGFSFSLEQIRSLSTPVNATERSFFNEFLNSLPNNPDDRVKLLVTILSKEYRVSRGLGIPENQNKLANNFASGDTGSPFDNIIGIPGDDIFENVLGPESLSSIMTIAADDNTSILPFERKYVDAAEEKKTYVPGSSYFTDSLLEITNNRFNTAPITDYSNLFTKKTKDVKSIVENLFSLKKRSDISPSKMNDSFLSSLKNSIENITNVSNINRDQAIIAGIFKLANSNNALKSKLFQYCLLTGLASNSFEDLKPIFKQLGTELGVVENLSEVQVGIGTGRSTNGGIRVLRPYIERLAEDISNKVLELTTPTPKISLAQAKKSKDQIIKIPLSLAQTAGAVSPYTRLSLTPLNTNETTIVTNRQSVTKVLLSNVDSQSSAVSNFIKEFVSLSNSFAQAAAYNGEEKYLVDDQSGRTRYNFISTTTQLLIVFEILSSYVSKYSFCNFVRSPSSYNFLISINAEKNNFVVDAIEDIVVTKTLDPVQVFINSGLTTKLITTNILEKSSTGASDNYKGWGAFSTMRHYGRSTVKRSGDSTRSGYGSKNYGGAYNKTKSVEEKRLLQANIASAFLGTQVLQNIGASAITALSFKKDTTGLRNALSAVRNKIQTEDLIIQNILNIVEVLDERVKQAKTKVLKFYNPETLSGFLEENTLEDLEIVRNPAQVSLSAFAINKFSNRTKNHGRIGKHNYTWFLDSEIIQPETRIALYSLLTNNNFLPQSMAERKIKVISVGVPAGFSKQLSDRIDQAAINKNTFKDKQFNVISINLYKRDQRFDDIIFKPQSFFFDLSLFQDEDEIAITKPEENERFDKILTKISIDDYESIIKSRKVSYQKIVNDEKYDFLTNDQKRSIIENHTISSLMQLYIRMLTGMRMEESSFMLEDINPGENLDQEFLDILYSYIKDILDIDIPNKPMLDLLRDPKFDEKAKDILRLFAYGDVIFEPQRLRNEVIKPKMFDRIFHFPINTEEFEIDEELTRETESGKLALEQTFVQERLVRNNDRLVFKPKSTNELLFEDYFVTIENVI